MPGVLIVEALAQVGGIVASKAESSNHKIGLLTGIDNCRFKGQIVKGKGVATVKQ
jgi:3-hydroxyacyl-[acyl-carrier-protein] dehydratase